MRIGALHAAAVQVRDPKDSLKAVGCPATPDADHSQARRQSLSVIERGIVTGKRIWAAQGYVRVVSPRRQPEEVRCRVRRHLASEVKLVDHSVGLGIDHDDPVSRPVGHPQVAITLSEQEPVRVLDRLVTMIEHHRRRWRVGRRIWRDTERVDWQAVENRLKPELSPTPAAGVKVELITLLDRQQTGGFDGSVRVLADNRHRRGARCPLQTSRHLGA